MHTIHSSVHPSAMPCHAYHPSLQSMHNIHPYITLNYTAKHCMALQTYTHAFWYQTKNAFRNPLQPRLWLWLVNDKAHFFTFTAVWWLQALSPFFWLKHRPRSQGPAWERGEMRKHVFSIGKIAERRQSKPLQATRYWFAPICQGSVSKFAQVCWIVQISEGICKKNTRHRVSSMEDGARRSRSSHWRLVLLCSATSPKPRLWTHLFLK